MRLGVMQPYLFPYPGYFDLIQRTDCWVVFDTPQYIRHGWVNRNRILSPLGPGGTVLEPGWQYVGVPLRSHSRGTPIQDIEIDERRPWRRTLLGQLAHYRKHAPCYRETVELVERCLTPSSGRLTELVVHSLAEVCRHLGIPFAPVLFSALAMPTDAIDGPGDWALEISRHLGASEYLNPPGGAALFDPARFAEAGVRLTIQEFEPLSYHTGRYTHVPNLSILDALMWCPPNQVRTMLTDPRPDRELASR